MVIDLLDHGDTETGIRVTDEDGEEVPESRHLVLPLEPLPEQWLWIRKLIENKPAEAARKIGIAQIADLANVKPRQPSPSLSEVFEVFAKAKDGKVTDRQVGKCKTYWEKLRKSLSGRGITNLRQMNKQATGDWADSMEHKYSPKTCSHAFLTARHVLKVFRERQDLGDRYDDAERALTCLQVAKPPHAERLKPSPMEAEDFAKLLSAAKGFASRKRHQSPHLDKQWEAMLLMAANGAMYLKDLADMRWSEIDLGKHTFVGHRKKKGRVVRVAWLWERTVDALRAWRRVQTPNSDPGSDVVFTSCRGRQTPTDVLTETYARLRAAAGLIKSPKTDFSAIRDRSYKIAWEAPEGTRYALNLVGHRNPGETDAYVERDPTMVRGVCEAVERYYFPRETGSAEPAHISCSKVRPKRKRPTR